jgi:transcriptional regulator with XRE-family HTH domain
MATKEEQLALRRRRGYWIRRARERKDLTLQAVATALGYSGNSLSTVSRWEDGSRQVPSDKLEPLGRLLSLPDSFLLRPPLTDDERLDAAVRDAEELERQDAGQAPAPARPVAAVPAPALRRRSA